VKETSVDKGLLLSQGSDCVMCCIQTQSGHGCSLLTVMAMVREVEKEEEKGLGG
jgi:hypothetical protein